MEQRGTSLSACVKLLPRLLLPALFLLQTLLAATTHAGFAASEHHQNTSSSNEALSLSYGSDASALANMARSVGQTVLANVNGAAGLPADANQASQTQSVISPGKVTITGTGDAPTDASSNLNVATLTSRDPQTANQALVNTLTLQQAQQVAQQRQQAANLVGSVLDQAIGDLSKDKWADGSPEKVLLHGLAGVVQAAVGDGNIAAGMAAGMVNEAALPAMASYLESQGVKQGSAEFTDLMTAGSTLLGTATGALAGGSNAASGANVAVNATVNNYLTHGQWTTFAAQMDACKAQAGGCSKEEQASITASWAAISAQQNAQLANCDATGDCAEIGKEVMAGTQTMLSLLDHLPIGGAPGTDLGQTLGENLANNATYRARMQDANLCQFDPNCSQGAMNAMTIATLPISTEITFARLITGSISAGVNAGAQMTFNGLSFSEINKTDVVMAGVAGTLTYGASFGSTVLVSAGASLWGSTIKNSSQADTVQGAIFSAAFSIPGYGIGALFPGGPSNIMSGLLGAFGGSTVSEVGAATINEAIQPQK